MNKFFLIKILPVLLITGFIFAWINTVCGQSRPNIIVIVTDDQGYADLGVQGQVLDIETPNIDELAKGGIRLTSGYVTAPQCVPSRSGLLSGEYQQRFGVNHNLEGPLPLNEILLQERIKAAGYVTGMVGKWHLQPNGNQKDWVKQHLPNKIGRDRIKIPISKKKPYLPSERGFDYIYQGTSNRYWANYNLRGERTKLQRVKKKRYRLDVQSDAALAFLKKEHNNNKPFFLYLSYYAPHVPLEATKKYLNRFPGEMKERRRYALAMHSAVDDGVGRIRGLLREKGMLENTLIFFLSDNGAALKVDKKDYPISKKYGAWNGSLNDPWVGEKGMLSEGGIRVPFIVSWPARLPKGEVYEKPVSSLDIAATSISAAVKPVNLEMDGVDLVPYLKNEKQGDPHEYLFWRFWKQSAVRAGQWKYLRAGQREYLFDMHSSKHEKVNLIKEFPSKANALRKKLEDWAGELERPGLPKGEVDREKKWYDYYFSNK